VKRELPSCSQIIYTNGDRLNDKRYNSLREAGVNLFVVTSHSGAPIPPRPAQIAQYPADLELTNRGGVLTDLPAPTAQTVVRPCFAPSEMLIVGATGDIHACYEDAERHHVMGNIMEQSLDDIWYSEEFEKIRSVLRQGRRLDAMDLCAKCTNVAHVEEGTSHLP
jgi:radical SAM protein with 4Fe4S-binding SPASM domain